MQDFMTLGLIIKKVCDLFTVNYKYGKKIQCVPSAGQGEEGEDRMLPNLPPNHHRSAQPPCPL